MEDYFVPDEQPPQPPQPPLSPEPKKKTNVWLIVGIVAIVLCCCLIVAGFGAKWLWNNGDEIFDLTQQVRFILA